MSEQPDEVPEFVIHPPAISTLWDLKHARTLYQEMDELDSADVIDPTSNPALYALYEQLCAVRAMFVADI